MRIDRHTRLDEFGGRLRLLPVDEFDSAQSAIHSRLRFWFAQSTGTGYRTILPDGRLLGPFNGFVRTPAIGGPHLDWAEAIASVGLASDVREATILTVGAHYQAAYIVYAHSRAARKAGISDSDVEALCATGHKPTNLSPGADLAHRLTVALLHDHDVPDELYAEAIESLGEPQIMTVIALIGQYVMTSALLNCFRIPAPPG